MVDGHAVRRGDVILPLTPMFHVNGWGLPYTAGLAPASLVFAGADTSPHAVASSIQSERPTVLAGIPTFWCGSDPVFASEDYDLSSVQRILCGGAEAAPALIERYTSRGIDFFHGWGMTEMSPSGTGNWIRAYSEDVEFGAKQGVPAPTVEMRIVSDDGSVLPWDDEAVGEIQVRGPWIAAAYLNPADDANEGRFIDGWLRTGDVGRVDPNGTLQIVDRIKDLIKSGGEWISSVELLEDDTSPRTHRWQRQPLSPCPTNGGGSAQWHSWFSERALIPASLTFFSFCLPGWRRGRFQTMSCS